MLPRHSLDSEPQNPTNDTHTNGSSLHGPSKAWEQCAQGDELSAQQDVEARQARQSSSSPDKWMAFGKMMEKLDRTKVHGWKEDIDTSLVFVSIVRSCHSHHSC